LDTALPELLYAVAKYVAYCVWCGVGLWLFAPGLLSAPRSLKFGALRWLLGLGFGIAAGVALGSVSRESVAMLYFSVYVPLRVVEWTIMAVVMRSSGGAADVLRNPRVWLWIVGGIVVSFASDLASPEGMAGRFCVGRCLC
jgi:hypothetical protein